jgi:DHA2 family multidrug resistance protein
MSAAVVAAPTFPQQRWLILVGLVTAAMLETLDVTITNVALPQIQGNIGATRQEAAWISTGYIISNVVVLPMTAWIADRFGRRRYLLFSIALFVAASMGCGLSHTLESLIGFRIVQGAAGAALLSTGEATLFQLFPRGERQLATGIFGLGVILGATIGPALGGYITDNYSWPWIFFISLPIGIVSASIIAPLLSDLQSSSSRGRIDWLGITLLASGFGSLQYILEEGQQNDWFNSELIVRLSILSALSLTAMTVWELSKKNHAPIVDLRVLRNPTLAGGVVVSFTLGFGLYTSLFLFPQFVQNILGYTATQSGMVMLLAGITEGIGIATAAFILRRPGNDPRWIISAGMLIFAYSMDEMCRFTMVSAMEQTEVAQLVRGFGLGAMVYCIDSTVLGSLKDPHEEHEGSALINLSRQLGGSFGIAICSTYLVTMTQFHRTTLVGGLWSGASSLTERSSELDRWLVSYGYSLSSAKSAALSMLNQDVVLNSTTLAFEDAFLLLGIVFICALPAVFFIKAKSN